MSTTPVTSGRQFELVTDEEWDRIIGKRMIHTDLHQAVEYLVRHEAGTKVKLKCSAEVYKKKYAALKEAADRRKLKRETRWEAGWLYLKKLPN